MTRNERQKITFQKIIDHKIDCIINCCTGYGKTKVAGDILLWCYNTWHNSNYYAKVNVIVPTNAIKDQWQLYINYLELPNITIWVINSIVKNSIELHDADLTIYDECHLFPLGQEFGKIFELTNTKYRLGLSGTLSRKHKEALSSLKRPLNICDTITIEEAERNEWCAKTIRYNLVIDYTDEDRINYDKINEGFNDAAAYFENDFTIILGCCSFKTKVIKGVTYLGAVDYVKSLYALGTVISTSEGKLTEQQAVKYLNAKANIARTWMEQRKEYIHKANCKINIVTELLYKSNLKAITFGQSIEVADIITNNLNLKGIKALSYHSKVDSQKVLESELIEHGILDKSNKTVNMFKEVQCSKDRLLPLYISKFDKNQIQVLNSAKALELGFDAKGVVLGVMVSGDSDKEGYVQCEGRTCRKENIIWKGHTIDKIACFVNIIIRNTKDEAWVKSRQYGKRGIKTMYNVDDIITDFHSILDNQIKLC